MSKNPWRKARKKPLIVSVRDVKGAQETIKTREGTLTAYADKDFIIKGTHGELYPIKKTIFDFTYELIK